MNTELTIVVPAYNERENIKILVDALDSKLTGINWEAIIVDDDSQDGTAALVREIAQRDERIRCIQRLNRKGLSSACIEGMLASSSPYLAVMDADMQHDESILPKMLEQLRQSSIDLVIGSRYMEGGSTGKLSPNRVWVSRLATKISRIILKSPISDPMSGFFMLKRTFFEQVMHKLSGKGFKILLDILVSADGNVKYVELPYVMRARTKGESKLNSQVIWEFFTLVAYKLLGHILPLRFISFATVGFSGIFVHLMVLGILHRLYSIDFVTSQTIATLVAMTSNFFLNNYFTFRERRLHGLGLLRGLFSFYLACSIGAIINVALAELLFEKSFPWWFSGFLGAVAGAVWNYAVTSTYTWSKKRTG